MTEGVTSFQCVTTISMLRTKILTSFDNKIRPSVTDRKFVNLMDAEFHKDTDGYRSAPIAFKKS